MSILSWNIQGLGNPWTVRHLRTLVKDSSPTIMFLMESPMHDSEVAGGRRCNTNEMVAFRHACNMCNLEDMDATGVKFTWSNGRQGCDNVKKRLDRFLANAYWCRLYPDALFQNLARISSYHSPIVCHFSPRVRKTEKMFRFESMWLRDESFHDVRDAWTSGLARGRQSDPCLIMEECSARISEWNKNNFGYVQKLIRSK
ncbi:reverse transcriptase [Tanacetum coccineum]